MYITYLASAVQKAILVRDVHGLRFPEATRSLDADAALVHFAACLFNLSYAVTHIAAKCNVRRLGTSAASTATF